MENTATRLKAIELGLIDSEGYTTCVETEKHEYYYECATPEEAECIVKYGKGECIGTYYSEHNNRLKPLSELVIN